MPLRQISLPFLNNKRTPVHSPRPSIDLNKINDGFGLPTPDDPDPFGVLALERAGLEIKEAGTKSRPGSDAFEYRPAMTSPVFRHSLQSVDGMSMRDPRRDSKRSILSVDQGTQTANIPSPTVEEPPQVYQSPLQNDFPLSESPLRNESSSPQYADAAADSINVDPEGPGEEEQSEEEPEPAIVEAVVPVASRRMRSPVATKAKLVTIAKPIPPALPLRSPLRARARASRSINAIAGAEDNDDGVKDDSSSVYSVSPTKTSFDLSEAPSPNPWSEQTSLEDAESLKQHDRTSEPASRQNSVGAIPDDGPESPASASTDAQDKESLAHGESSTVQNTPTTANSLRTFQNVDKSDADQYADRAADRDLDGWRGQLDGSSQSPGIALSPELNRSDSTVESKYPASESSLNGDTEVEDVEDWRDGVRAKDAKEEEFHSVPGTPIDVPMPGAFEAGG